MFFTLKFDEKIYSLVDVGFSTINEIKLAVAVFHTLFRMDRA